LLFDWYSFMKLLQIGLAPKRAHTNNCFMALLDFVWDYPGKPAPER